MLKSVIYTVTRFSLLLISIEIFLYHSLLSMGISTGWSFPMFKVAHCTGAGFNTKLDPGPRTLLQRTRLRGYAGNRKRETLQQVLQRGYSAPYDSSCHGCPTEEAKSWIRGCCTHTFSDQEKKYIKGMRL